MKPIKAIMIEPGEFPKGKELMPTTEAFIQAISVGISEIGELKKIRLDEYIYIIYNGQAPLTFEGNRRIGKQIICGTFYIVAIEKGVPRSITNAEAIRFMDRFHEIETFDDWEVICQYADELCSKL